MAAQPPALAPRRPPARENVLEGTQAVLQQLLRVATQLSSGLEQGDSVQKLLEEYGAFLWSLDRKADSLQSFRVPLDAIRHLDGSGLALGPWCKGLIGRLREANTNVRERVAPLESLRERLCQEGWGATAGGVAAAPLEPSWPSRPSSQQLPALGRSEDVPTGAVPPKAHLQCEPVQPSRQGQCSSEEQHRLGAAPPPSLSGREPPASADVASSAVRQGPPEMPSEQRAPHRQAVPSGEPSPPEEPASPSPPDGPPVLERVRRASGRRASQQAKASPSAEQASPVVEQTSTAADSGDEAPAGQRLSGTQPSTVSESPFREVSSAEKQIHEALPRHASLAREPSPLEELASRSAAPAIPRAEQVHRAMPRQQQPAVEAPSISERVSPPAGQALPSRQHAHLPPTRQAMPGRESSPLEQADSPSPRRVPPVPERVEEAPPRELFPTGGPSPLEQLDTLFPGRARPEPQHEHKVLLRQPLPAREPSPQEQPESQSLAQVLPGQQCLHEAQPQQAVLARQPSPMEQLDCPYSGQAPGHASPEQQRSHEAPPRQALPARHPSPLDQSPGQGPPEVQRPHEAPQRQAVPAGVLSPLEQLDSLSPGQAPSEWGRSGQAPPKHSWLSQEPSPLEQLDALLPAQAQSRLPPSQQPSPPAMKVAWQSVKVQGMKGASPPVEHFQQAAQLSPLEALAAEQVQTRPPPREMEVQVESPAPRRRRQPQHVDAGAGRKLEGMDDAANQVVAAPRQLTRAASDRILRSHTRREAQPLQELPSGRRQAAEGVLSPAGPSPALAVQRGMAAAVHRGSRLRGAGVGADEAPKKRLRILKSGS